MIIKLIVVLGPTASGKSSLAVKLAKRFGGEIVSADSRQIYRGMEIGTGTVTKKEMQGIPHSLLSFRNPKLGYTAAQYKRAAVHELRAIHTRATVPFLVGGTGFWIDAVCQNIQFPKSKPDMALRKKLARKTPAHLFALLKKLDPEKAKIIDAKNPRRIIRAIEIARSGATSHEVKKGKRIFSCLYLGIKKDKAVLRRAIKKRFREWIRNGFCDEVRALMRRAILPERFKELGLHYWLCYQYCAQRIPYDEFEKQSIASIGQYAKRQMTWFSRNRDIHWVTHEADATTRVKKFLCTRA